VVVVDTREQTPFDLEPFGVEHVRRTLKTGDYSAVGMEHRVTVERKRVGELFGCFARERERFRREFERMASFEYAAVVIEGSLADVLRGDPRSEVRPATVINSLHSWSVRYGVHVWYAGDRECAAATCVRLLESFWKATRLPPDARPKVG